MNSVGHFVGWGFVLLGCATARLELRAKNSYSIRKLCSASASGFSNYLTRPHFCHPEIQEASSLPFLGTRKTPFLSATEYKTRHDPFGVSVAQHDAFLWLHVCGQEKYSDGNKAGKESTTLSLRPGAALLTQTRSLMDFLAEENVRRRKWVLRSVGFIWNNYQELTMGAPELDPRTGRGSHGEWLQLPIFMYDNLDAIWVAGYRTAFWRACRYLEIGILLNEIHAGVMYYPWYRNIYLSEYLRYENSPRAPDPTPAHIVRLLNVWLQSDDPALVEDLSKLLSIYISTVLPHWNGDVLDNSRSGVLSILRYYRSHPQLISSFSIAKSVSLFETTIRTLGGLLSAFHMSGHPVLLYLGWEIGFRLSRNFFEGVSNTTLRDATADDNFRHQAQYRHPCRSNKSTFAPCDQMMYLMPPRLPRTALELSGWRNPDIPPIGTFFTTPAEAGTLQLEFGSLAELTDTCLYFDSSEEVIEEIVISSGNTGIVGSRLSAHPRSWPINMFGDYRLNEPSDSFYELMIKQWVQTGKRDEMRFDFVTKFMKALDSFIVIRSTMCFNQSSGVAPLYSPVADYQTMRIYPPQNNNKLFINRMFGTVPTSLLPSPAEEGSESMGEMGTVHLGKYQWVNNNDENNNNKNNNNKINNSKRKGLTNSEDYSDFIGIRTFNLLEHHSDHSPSDLRLAEQTHLGCFIGGLIGLAVHEDNLSSKSLFESEKEKTKMKLLAEELSMGCAALYFSTPAGLGPESTLFRFQFLDSMSEQFLLRPEAIESLSVMSRLTNKVAYRNLIWRIFLNIDRLARSRFGYCSIDSVFKSPLTYTKCREDTWILAETFKYILLSFSSDGTLRKSMLPSLRKTQRAISSAQRTAQIVKQFKILSERLFFNKTDRAQKLMNDLKENLMPIPLETIFGISRNVKQLRNNQLSDLTVSPFRDFISNLSSSSPILAHVLSPNYSSRPFVEWNKPMQWSLNESREKNAWTTNQMRASRPKFYDIIDGEDFLIVNENSSSLYGKFTMSTEAHFFPLRMNGTCEQELGHGLGVGINKEYMGDTQKTKIRKFRKEFGVVSTAATNE